MGYPAPPERIHPKGAAFSDKPSLHKSPKLWAEKTMTGTNERRSTGVVVASLAIVIASPTMAADMRVLPAMDQQVTFLLSGRIVAGDAAKFRILRDRTKDDGSPITVIRLNSPGGLIGEAIDLAQMIRADEITTRVPKGANCTSACFVIFASGIQKFAENGARIGIHSGRDLNEKETDRSAVSTMVMARVLQSYGVPDRIVRQMEITAPDKMAWLSPDELRSTGATVGTAAELARVRIEAPARPGAAAIPSPTPSQTHAQAPDIAGLAQRAVLYEQDPVENHAKGYIGSVIWRIETLSAVSGRMPELAIDADIEIPERRIDMTMSVRRNNLGTLPTIYTIENTFDLPADLPSGGIARIPGILMGPDGQTLGTPLSSLAVKATPRLFLIALSSVESDVQKNLKLLKEKPWFELPILFNNGSRAILAVEKGASGEEAFKVVFAAWEASALSKPDHSVEPNPEAYPSSYVVQVASQRSGANAQAAFRTLQARYPGLLAARRPIVRRADLGDNGIYYRALVGPFSTMDEATRFCADLKAAGGMCSVNRTEAPPNE